MAASAGKTARLALYAADADWMPTTLVTFYRVQNVNKWLMDRRLTRNTDAAIAELAAWVQQNPGAQK